MILLGQPTLRKRLRMGTFAALDQRIAVRYELTGMTDTETVSYLHHHLELSGRKDTLFADDAIALLHRTSRGIPRALNNLATQALIACYAKQNAIVDLDCAQAAVAEVHSRMTATVRTLLDDAPSDQDEPAGSVLPAPAGWPAPPGPAAYHGLLGEIVRRLEPETEADPVAILAQLLVCFGAAVGRGAYFQVEATRHHPQEFVLIVGESATSRKGTSWDHARRLIATADATLSRADPDRSELWRGTGVGGARPDRLRSRHPGPAAARIRSRVRQRPEGLLRAITRHSRQPCAPRGTVARCS